MVNRLRAFLLTMASMLGNKKPAQSSPQSSGQWGEAQALHHLESRGYTIIATNYRKRYGEIDIIARDGATLVFIEVKYRRHSGYGTGLEAVDRRKQLRLCRVAAEYLQSHQQGDSNARFDVIAVAPAADGAGAVIDHIENAFDFLLE